MWWDCLEEGLQDQRGVAAHLAQEDNIPEGQGQELGVSRELVGQGSAEVPHHQALVTIPGMCCHQAASVCATLSSLST